MRADRPHTDMPPAPAWWKLALEARAPFEFGASLAALPLLAMSPRGDGHPVLVFPGMLASDLSTQPLRQWLRWLGHDVHGWQMGRNLGPRPALLDASLARIRELRRGSGRKVSLVGQSLGGIYARELAKQAAADVRCVVTLGTPFTGGPRSTNAWQIFEQLNGREHLAPAARAGVRQTPPVPTTSIWSRSDGVVAWQCSLEHDGPASENLEVEASHTGMGVNPLVLHALADRLAQPEGVWAPFERSGLRRAVYRSAG
jgi:predicted alpha/beta hydrolase family esterase